MKKITLALMILALSCAKDKDWATISIQPNQSFLLGELEDTSFEATVKNLSNEGISFLVIETSTKVKRSGFGISKKGQVEVFIDKDETAIFKNESNREIKIKVLLDKDVEGMRYVENNKNVL